MLDELTAVEVVVRIFEAQNLSGKSVGKGYCVRTEAWQVGCPITLTENNLLLRHRSFLPKLK